MTDSERAGPRAAAIVIGRNEGERLTACLRSAQSEALNPVIYVDSGSTDNSIAEAKALGADVVFLETDQPFTAARARNAGLSKLMSYPDPPPFVQFIDGDCELRAGWVVASLRFLASQPKAAAVCGRRRERSPDASVYNWLTDLEWDAPTGAVRSCGGDVMIRVSAIEAAGRYNPSLIAGEEPELCVRLRQKGWTIWRLDTEMTWHDAAMMRFAQWWTRSRRAGHAFAEGAMMHGALPERHNIPQLRRSLAWGLVLPLVILVGLVFTPWAAALALLWPAKVMRLMVQGRSATHALFLTIGNFPETLGALSFYRAWLMGKRTVLIEYK